MNKYKEERFRGETVRMLACGSVNHATVISNLHFLIRSHLKGGRCRIYTSAVTYALSPGNDVSPDLSVLCNLSLLDRDKIKGAPTLAVEVISPSSVQYDRGVKMKLYAEAGVEEYWLVDPEMQTIELYVMEDGKYLRSLTSRVLPDMPIDPALVFENVAYAYDE